MNVPSGTTWLENPLVVIRCVSMFFPVKPSFISFMGIARQRPKQDTCHPTRTPHQSLMHLRLHFGEASHAQKKWPLGEDITFNTCVYILCIYDVESYEWYVYTCLTYVQCLNKYMSASMVPAKSYNWSRQPVDCEDVEIWAALLQIASLPWLEKNSRWPKVPWFGYMIKSMMKSMMLHESSWIHLDEIRISSSEFRWHKWHPTI